VSPQNSCAENLIPKFTLVVFRSGAFASLATPPTAGVGKDVGKKEPSYTVGGNVN
jgi:hypothetical protein